MQETQVLSLGLEDPPEKEMATHYSILAWKFLGSAESMRSQVSDTTWLSKHLSLG